MNIVVDVSLLLGENDSFTVTDEIYVIVKFHPGQILSNLHTNRNSWIEKTDKIELCLQSSMIVLRSLYTLFLSKKQQTVWYNKIFNNIFVFMLHLTRYSLSYELQSHYENFIVLHGPKFSRELHGITLVNAKLTNKAPSLLLLRNHWRFTFTDSELSHYVRDQR